MRPLIRLLMVTSFSMFYLVFSVNADEKLIKDEKLDVLNMKEIPPGIYAVTLEFSGKKQVFRAAIAGSSAGFIDSDSEKLQGFSGQFELLGNGVFLARFSGKSHGATQWWLFKPDGSAIIREVPDRGEKQSAKPIKISQNLEYTGEASSDAK